MTRALDCRFDRTDKWGLQVGLVTRPSFTPIRPSPDHTLFGLAGYSSWASPPPFGLGLGLNPDRLSGLRSRGPNDD